MVGNQGPGHQNDIVRTGRKGIDIVLRNFGHENGKRIVLCKRQVGRLGQLLIDGIGVFGKPHVALVVVVVL